MNNFAFATCVQLGMSCIEKIHEIGGKLDLLITLDDKIAKNKSGRVYLDKIAKEHSVDLLKIKNINDEIVIEQLKSKNIDWLFIIGWSQIAKKKLLETPTKGCIGMHPTLLPIGRGRAAIPWAILKQLPETGVTMFKIDQGVDTGDIIAQKKIALDTSVNATTLYQKVQEAHIELIADEFENILTDSISLTEQNENKATYWEKRTPNDGQIINSHTMEEADLLIRAVTHPYPGAFYLDTDKKIKIWSATFDKYEGMIQISDGYINPLDYEIEYVNAENN